jgi:hypothetical protein
MCPHCGQDAPLRYSGVAAFCSACGRPRPPLIARSVSHAGKPAQVGGTLAGVFGWIVLAVGLAVATGIGLVLSIIHTTFGLAVGIPIAVLSIAVSLGLLFSGKKLRQSGEAREKETRRKAVFSLARNRGGAITANDAATALDMPPADADAFLTDLAKTTPEEVTVELDDRGGIYYQFPRLLPERRRARIEDPRVRVTGVPDTFESEGLDYEEPAHETPQERRRRGL